MSTMRTHLLLPLLFLGACADGGTTQGRTESQEMASARPLSPEMRSAYMMIDDTVEGDYPEHVPGARAPWYNPNELRRTMDAMASVLAPEVKGTVRVRVQVTEDGLGVGSTVIDGIDSLGDFLALNVVRGLHYVPAILDGREIKMSVIIPVPINLPESPRSDTIPPSDAPRSDTSAEYPDFVQNARMPSYSVAELQSHVVYPPEAMEAGIEGKVYVQAKINEEGTVVDAVVVKRLAPLLDAAALDAVRKTSFTPAMQDGRPVRMKVVIPVAFTLSK